MFGSLMDNEKRMQFVILSLAVSLLTGCPAAADQLFSERNDARAYFYGTIGRTLEVEMTLAKHGLQNKCHPLLPPRTLSTDVN
jgi:hypothetical protein